MLSPSSPAEKNLSEEDSSGSDAGSEVGLEPATDRFGFIVANGSTAGSVGPPPELVRQRETKWISIILQWDRMLLKKTSKVKVQCQKGIPASLRAKCWPLLCAATDRMKQNENLYESLDSEPALQSWVDVIERDLDRQFPFHEMFLSKDGHGQRGLFRVLKAYTQYQPEEGYCQAQGPVAAVLLMNMPAEEAFWCLVQISEQYLPGYYSPLLEGVLFDAGMLTWVLKRTCPAAHKHLQHHGVEPLMFATDWLMCLFTRHLPFNTLLRVWDLFFCYGVRVLLQVAVVLVRRVLGRAEQRKQCQGQMETLELLRGVREQVQEEDEEDFIAEVCSVPLSARDLEKRTEKALEKWRKERPSSTFDPRGRCQGYRMAWARARRSEEERDRKEREKGNLSVPLARSASTLSLSPSLLHKRLRKGGKVNAGEWEGGRKVVRHLSMGAREDWRSWSDLNFKKVEGVQEEEDVEEHKKQSESIPTGQAEEKELLEEPKEMDKVKNIPSERAEKPVIVVEQTEQDATQITKKEESQPKVTEDDKMLSEQTEETNVETEPNPGPAEDQTGHNSDHEQGQEQDSYSQLQVLEQQSHKGQDQETEVKGSEEEKEKRMSGSQDSAAGEESRSKVQKDADADTYADEKMQVNVDSSEGQMIQVDVKPEEATESKTEQQMQVDTVTEVSETRTETSPGNIEAATITHPETTTETEIQEEVITETDRRLEGDTTEAKCQSTESLEETEIKEEPHTQTETETEEKVEESAATPEELVTQTVQIDSGQHIDPKTEAEAETLIPSSPESIPREGDADVAADTEVEAEISVADGTAKESSEAPAHFSETECETVASDPPQEKEEIILTVHSEAQADSDQTQAEETPGETQTTVETTDSLALGEPQTEVETTDSVALAETQTKVETTDSVAGGEPQTKVETTDSVAGGEPQTKVETTDSVALAETQTKVETTDSVALGETQTKVETTDSVALGETQTTVETTDSVALGETQTKVETTDSVALAETQTKVETTDSVAPPEEETSRQAEAVNLSTELHWKATPVETMTSEEPAPEEPTNPVTMGPWEEEQSVENVQENAVGEDDVFISTPNVTDEPHADSNPQVQNKESSPSELNNSGPIQASGRRGSRSSGDFCVRKSSSSHGSRLARRLSQDLFTSPQKTGQSQSVPDHPEVKHSEPQPDPAALNPTQNPQPAEATSSPSTKVTEETAAEQEPPAHPKRFGLFRRLRGEQPKKTKEKGSQKMQVPKILIQDFSDGKGMEKVVAEGEEKLSSRERRRRRREQERREKEEERLRKKKEKEMEKERREGERERRKPQTRGKSFQVQKEKGSDDPPQPAKTGSKTLRHSASYAESYF